MPTTIPRIQVTLKPSTNEILDRIAKTENESKAHIVTKLVEYAIELAEDLSLVEKAGARLDSFVRDDALTSNELLKWNRNRRKKK